MKNTDGNNSIRKVLANRVKEIRENKNITQLQCLIDTNIHIGRIEMGKTNVTVETLTNICTYLNITVSDLLKDIEQN